MNKFSMSAIILGFVLILMAAFSVTPLGSKANEYAVELSTDSIQTFLALRAVNAGLSLAQEVEFTGSIGILAGSAQPLKILEPLDDAVEYLSTAVFIAGSFATVVSSVLHIAGPVGIFTLGLGAIFAGAGRSNYIPQDYLQKAKEISGQLLRTGAALYFLVASFALSSAINDYIGNAAWAEHASVLADVSEQMAEIALQSDNDIAGMLNDAEESISTTAETTPSDQEEGAGGILGTLNGIGRATVEITEDAYQSVRDTAAGTVTSVRASAERAVLWGRISAQSADVILTHADELMIAFFGILAAYIFKLLALPLIAYLVLMRLFRRI